MLAFKPSKWITLLTRVLKTDRDQIRTVVAPSEAKALTVGRSPRVL